MSKGKTKNEGIIPDIQKVKRKVSGKRKASFNLLVTGNHIQVTSFRGIFKN